MTGQTEAPITATLPRDQADQADGYETAKAQESESKAASKKTLQHNSPKSDQKEVEESCRDDYPESCLGDGDEEDDDDYEKLLAQIESIRIDNLKAIRPVSPNHTTPNHPLRLTGHIFQDWHSHSWVDPNTGQMFIQRDVNNQRYAEHGVKCNTPCHWVRLSKPGLPSRPKMPASIPPTKVVEEEGKQNHPLVPELKLTTPEGKDYWLDDLTYYPGETNWADSDDEEDD